MTIKQNAIANHVIQGQFFSSEYCTFLFSGISSMISDILPAFAVSFGVIEFSVRFEIVKLVDFNEIEPKSAPEVVFFVSSFVVDVVDIVDVVIVAVDDTDVVVSLLASVFFFNSLILFISGSILIVAKNFSTVDEQ